VSTRSDDRPGLKGAAKLAADRVRSIVALELQLAARELKRKVAAFGLAIAMLVGAAALLLFGVGFGLATIVAAIATATSLWLALLIVTGGIFVLVGVLIVVGVVAIRRATPPLPKQAIHEAKLTLEAMRNGRH
jgi:Putative Actinobacterial Holin-X, holin superfamily III